MILLIEIVRLYKWIFFTAGLYNGIKPLIGHLSYEPQQSLLHSKATPYRRKRLYVPCVPTDWTFAISIV